MAYFLVHVLNNPKFCLIKCLCFAFMQRGTENEEGCADSPTTAVTSPEQYIKHPLQNRYEYLMYFYVLMYSEHIYVHL